MNAVDLKSYLMNSFAWWKKLGIDDGFCRLWLFIMLLGVNDGRCLEKSK